MQVSNLLLKCGLILVKMGAAVKDLQTQLRRLIENLALSEQLLDASALIFFSLFHLL